MDDTNIDLSWPNCKKKIWPINDDIVISGIGGRFPESDNLDELTKNLLENIDMVTCDERRWPIGLYNDQTSRSGKIKNLEFFDNSYFCTIPILADTMEPGSRIILETTYEAIADAGIAPQHIRGTKTGVYVGINTVANAEAIPQDDFSDIRTKDAAFWVYGSSRALLANRISFLFDFNGPSTVIDTACSSSMVAMANAVQDLRNGICEMAIVASSNICLAPYSNYVYHSLGLLSKDGKCKVFDKNADGFVRSETVGSLFLMLKSKAKRIYATILHAKTNTDGFKTIGLFSPFWLRQRNLMIETYQEAGISPQDIDYFESHGTGTYVGDPQETKAVSQAYCTDRKDKLLMGAVKSNMGHTEGASGLCSIAKAIIIFENNIIPANLHYNEPKPEIECLHKTIEPIVQNQPFNGKIIGVNSFGVGGVNAHALLQINDKILSKNEQIYSNDIFNSIPRLINVCGRTEHSIQLIFDFIENNPLKVNNDFLALLNDSMKTTLIKGSTNFPYRGFMIIEKLTNNHLRYHRTIDHNQQQQQSQLWLIFTGMGSQWNGMAKQLMNMKTFAESIENSAAILKEYGIDLKKLILNDQMDNHDDNNCTINSFVSITSMQIALYDVIKLLNLPISGFIGHSFGEIACAYADNCLTAKQAILTSYWRGKTVQDSKSLLPKGLMAAVGMSVKELEKILPNNIYIACHNGHNSVTISGHYQSMIQFIEQLRTDNIFVREINGGDFPYHSAEMKKIAHKMLEKLDQIIDEPKKRSNKWITTSVCSHSAEQTNHDYDVAYATGKYFVNNLQNPVYFEEGMKQIASKSLCIEIAPHSLFNSIFKRYYKDHNYLSLMKKSEKNQLFYLLQSIGKIYSFGFNADIENLYYKIKWPVCRGTQSISSLIRWDHGRKHDVKKYPDYHNFSTSSNYWVQISIIDSDWRFLKDHQIDGRIVFPFTGYLWIVWRAMATKYGQPWHRVPIHFKNVRLQRPTILSETKTIKFTVQIIERTGDFVLLENNSLICKGNVCVPNDRNGDIFLEHQSDLNDDCFSSMNDDENDNPISILNNKQIYKELRVRGYDYGDSFKGLFKANSDGQYASLKWTGHWISFADSAMHLSLLSMPIRSLFIPIQINSFKCDPFFLFKSIDYNRIGLNCSNNNNNLNIQIQNATFNCLGGHNDNNNNDNNNHSNDSDETINNNENDKNINFNNSIAFEIMNFSNINIDNNSNRALTNDESLYNVKFDLNNQSLITTGIEIKGIVPINFQRKLDDQKLVLQKYQFISLNQRFNDFFAESNSLPTNTEESLLENESFIRPLLDLIVENSEKPMQQSLHQNEQQKINKLKILEICMKNQKILHKNMIDNLEKNYSISSKQLQIDYYVVVNSDDHCQNDPIQNESNNAQINKYKLIQCNNTDNDDDDKSMQFLRQHFDSPNFDLILMQITNDSSDVHMDNITKLFADLLKPLGFLLIISLDNQLSERLRLSVNNFFSSISTRIAKKQQTNVELYRRKSSMNIIDIIHIYDSNTFEWINKLQKLLSKNDFGQLDRIWLISYKCEIGLIGFLRSLRLEMNCANIIRIVMLSDMNVNFKLTNDLMDKDLLFNIENLNQINDFGTYRYVNINKSIDFYVKTDNAYVNQLCFGDLSSFEWIQQEQFETTVMNSSSKSVNEQIICNVYYSSLNFKDVVLSTAKIMPGPESAIFDCMIGLEFSGRRHDTNERIMGMIPFKGIATKIKTLNKYVWKIPNQWTLQDAATIPVIYTTAYYALIIRAQLKPFNSILIHSAAGGVGQAALNICIYYKCNIFVTVGNQTKRKYLQEKYNINDDHIFSSRDSYFEYGIKSLTNGRGVDIVLNSLTGQKLLASLRCLANNGKFLEIGKYDIQMNSTIGMLDLMNNISFHTIAIDSLFRVGQNLDSDSFQSFFNEISDLINDGIEKGIVKPIDRTIFDIDQIENAFRYMIDGKHIGKVLIRIRHDDDDDSDHALKQINIKENLIVNALRRTSFDMNKIYIIAGGLGGIGIEFIHWMILRGARRFIITSRTGIRNPFQRSFFERFKIIEKYFADYQIEYDISTKNIANHDECFELINLALTKGSIGGVFNLAMILNDAIFMNQSIDTFQHVCRPKLNGLLNLDRILRQMNVNVDHFIAFSSFSSGHGNFGQTNYSYANSAMERIIENRLNDGLSGICVQFGPIGDAGIVAENYDSNSELMIMNKKLGLRIQRINSCLNVLDKIISKKYGIYSSYLLYEQDLNDQNDDNEVIKQLCAHLNIDNRPDNECLGDIGLDSMAAIEIQQRLERDFNIQLSLNDVRKITVKELKNFRDGNHHNLKQYSDDIKRAKYNLSRIRFVIPTVEISALNLAKQQNKFSNQQPLYCLPVLIGIFDFVQVFIQKLDRPVFGLNWTKSMNHLTTFEEISDYYYDLIEKLVDSHHSDRDIEYFDILAIDFGISISSSLLKRISRNNKMNLRIKFKIKHLICIDLLSMTTTSNQLLNDHLNNDNQSIMNEKRLMLDLKMNLLFDYIRLYIPESILNKSKDDIFTLDNQNDRINKIIELLNKCIGQNLNANTNNVDMNEIIQNTYARASLLIDYQLRLYEKYRKYIHHDDIINKNVTYFDILEYLFFKWIRLNGEKLKIDFIIIKSNCISGNHDEQQSSINQILLENFISKYSQKNDHDQQQQNLKFHCLNVEKMDEILTEILIDSNIQSILNE